jgi:DNA-binding PadR family transcriptional regulator
MTYHYSIYSGGGVGKARSGSVQISESMFRVLAALRDPLHGYGIMRRVREESGGTVVIGPATLYTALTQLEEKGYIVRTSEPEDARGKKTYLITEAGRLALAEEARRFEALARTGLAAARRGDGHD